MLSTHLGHAQMRQRGAFPSSCSPIWYCPYSHGVAAVCKHMCLCVCVCSAA